MTNNPTQTPEQKLEKTIEKVFTVLLDYAHDKGKAGDDTPEPEKAQWLKDVVMDACRQWGLECVDSCDRESPLYHYDGGDVQQSDIDAEHGYQLAQFKIRDRMQKREG